jgi:hypothetical protein
MVAPAFTFPFPQNIDLRALTMGILKSSPFLLYSDGKGKIFEDNPLPPASGWDARPIPLKNGLNC